MTDRKIGAVIGVSPFWASGPVNTGDTSKLQENPLWIRELVKAIGESVTKEEWMIIFKLGMAIGKVFRDMKPEDVNGLLQAWETGWALMKKYRETGEP